MATSNERIRDGLIRHQVDLQRLGRGLAQEAIALLDRTEASVAADIRETLSRGVDVTTSSGLRRLQHLEDLVREARLDAMDALTGNIRDSSADLVRHEAEFAAKLLDVNSPVVLDLVVPAVSTISAIVSQPFEGHDLDTWFSRLAERDSRNIMDAVRVGLTRGQPIDDIVRSVIGSQAADGADGVTQITRSHIASLVRTAVNSFSSDARRQTFDANKDVLSWEVYTATLDGRTSPICRSLDGKVYRVGEGKFPPQHFGCRSIRVAALDGALIGDRPMKPVTERMVLAEYNDLNGTEARSRADLPRGSKGDFDAYARRRVRELTGTVAAKTTYQEFLARQSASFQDEVLGPTRAKLFRDGGLALDKYVHRDGTELSLAELAKKNAAAFRKAGLDPARYALPKE